MFSSMSWFIEAFDASLFQAVSYLGRARRTSKENLPLDFLSHSFVPLPSCLKQSFFQECNLVGDWSHRLMEKLISCHVPFWEGVKTRSWISVWPREKDTEWGMVHVSKKSSLAEHFNFYGCAKTGRLLSNKNPGERVHLLDSYQMNIANVFVLFSSVWILNSQGQGPLTRTVVPSTFFN